jgi:hypothetical protein
MSQSKTDCVRSEKTFLPQKQFFGQSRKGLGESGACKILRSRAARTLSQRVKGLKLEPQTEQNKLSRLRNRPFYKDHAWRGALPASDNESPYRFLAAKLACA